MLAAERRQVSKKVIGNALGLAHGRVRAVQIAGIPQRDGRDEEVEAGSAVLLVFVGAVADFAELRMKTARAKLLRDSPLLRSRPVSHRNSGSSIPIERDQGALEPAQLAQRRSNAFLPGIGGQLAHNQ